MDVKKFLYPPHRARDDNYKVIIGVLIAIVSIYFVIDNFSELVKFDDQVGSYSSYHGQSFYDDEDNENVYPNRVKYNYYNGPKEKACIVMLAKNDDLYKVLPTIKNVEDRFNLKFNYDWVFLNNQPHSEDFKYVVGEIVSGKVHFGTIPDEHWQLPDSVDKKKAFDARVKLKEDRNIFKGGELFLPQVWRYMSGLFHIHPVFDEYEYYWIIEPDMKLTCDVNYDIFKFMKENNKKYGFFHAKFTRRASVPTLWSKVTEFISTNSEMISNNNLMKFISDDEGKSYNMCGYAASIEVGSFEFFRSKNYRAFFEFMDKQNGWFYERWSSNDMRSIAASLLLNKDEVHHFADQGYHHSLGKYSMEAACPLDKQMRLEAKCICNPFTAMSWMSNSCLPKFYDATGRVKPEDWKSLQSI